MHRSAVELIILSYNHFLLRWPGVFHDTANQVLLEEALPTTSGGMQVEIQGRSKQRAHAGSDVTSADAWVRQVLLLGWTRPSPALKHSTSFLQMCYVDSVRQRDLFKKRWVMEFTAVAVSLYPASYTLLRSNFCYMVHNLKQKRNIFNLFLLSLDSSLSTHTPHNYRWRVANVWQRPGFS